MSLDCRQKINNEYEIIEDGIVNAVCCSVIDLGLQHSNWNGEDKTVHKVCLIFEVTQTYKNGDFAGERMLISKEYNFSIHEKSTLRKDLESWRGKKFIDGKDAEGFYLLYSDDLKTKMFNLEMLKNIKASLYVIHKQSAKGGTFANIDKIMKPAQNNQMTVNNLNYIPEFIQTKIDNQIIKVTESTSNNDFPDTTGTRVCVPVVQTCNTFPEDNDIPF